MTMPATAMSGKTYFGSPSVVLIVIRDLLLPSYNPLLTDFPNHTSFCVFKVLTSKHFLCEALVRGSKKKPGSETEEESSARLFFSVLEHTSTSEIAATD